MDAMNLKEHEALVQVVVERWRDSERKVCSDDVAEEVPVALEYNGISHAVMLASPYHLEDFALGFSLSEGILAAGSELFECEIEESGAGIQVKMRIAGQRFAALKDRRRNLTGRTGCGLCGAETLEQAIRQPPRVADGAHFSARSIHAGMEAMGLQQRLQQHTGATHAAAWLDADGAIALVREDIGRHNALDKLIGAMAGARRSFENGAALITSRASYEMVQKAATVGIGFLAAISAPTSLAVQLAGESNVTLLGFVRRGSHVVYAQPHRLIHEGSTQ